MTSDAQSSGASWACRLEVAFFPLVAAAGAAGLAFPMPGRAAVDRGAISAVLVVLVLASAASVQIGAAGRLRAGAGRLSGVLALSTVALAGSAWAVSHLVTDPALSHGVLALGVAPTEIATVALTALAGGDVAVTAALLMSSTVISVVIAGPVLAFEAGGRVDAARVLVDLALIVAVPMAIGLGCRQFLARTRRLVALVEPASMVAVVVLVELVASQVHLTRSYAAVAVALVGFIAASTASGAAISHLFPRAERTAIRLSIAVRDFAIASGIATSAFGAATAGPLGLYGMLVIGWGALLARQQRPGLRQIST